MSNVAQSPFAALFTEDSVHQTWLDVEVALAVAQAELGIIPAAAAAEIAAKAKLELVDRDAFTRHLEVTGHALVSLVWQIDALCEGDAGGYLHWGATFAAELQETSEVAANLTGEQLAELLDASRYVGLSADFAHDAAAAARAAASWLAPAVRTGS